MKTYSKPDIKIIELQLDSLVALSLQDGKGEANPDIDILSIDNQPTETNDYWHHTWED